MTSKLTKVIALTFGMLVAGPAYADAWCQDDVDMRAHFIMAKRRQASLAYAQEIAYSTLYAEQLRGLPPGILLRIAYRESKFDPDALGGIGERSIMQLHPHGVASKGVQFVRRRSERARCAEAADRCQHESILRAAWYLQHEIARCGSVVAGLGAYNSGKCWVSPYTRRVLKGY